MKYPVVNPTFQMHLGLHNANMLQ